jgi:hypothetical protein
VTEQPEDSNARPTPSRIAQSAKTIVWVDVSVLALACLASLPGLFRILFAIVAGVLLWSKVAVGLVANAQLLAGRRATALAYVAASVAMVGAIFTLAFVDGGAGASPRSWAYQHRSGLQTFFIAWSVGWNVLYVAAARTLQPAAVSLKPVSGT